MVGLDAKAPGSRPLITNDDFAKYDGAYVAGMHIFKSDVNPRKMDQEGGG